MNSPETQTPWRRKGKSPEDYEWDRVNKYAQYFQGNTILPIPKVTNQLETRMVSFIVTDLRLKRLAWLKKVFGELLRTSRVPCRYSCWRNYATWDILLPTEGEAQKFVAKNIVTKFNQLQPKEYMGSRRIKVTMCNVPRKRTSFLTS